MTGLSEEILTNQIRRSTPRIQEWHTVVCLYQPSIDASNLSIVRLGENKQQIIVYNPVCYSNQYRGLKKGKMNGTFAINHIEH